MTDRSHVLPLDPESERRLAAAWDRVREQAHEARLRKHAREVQVLITIDQGGHVTMRSRIRSEESLGESP